jgi:CRP-like cAMP-binding protein
VVAVRETTLKFLSRAAFEEFAREHPEVYQNLMKVLATRLRLTDETVAAGISSH